MSMPFRPGDLVGIRRERWRVERHVSYGASAVLDVAGCDRHNRRQRARFLLPCEPIDRLPATHTPQVRPAARIRDAVRTLVLEATPDARALRAAAKARMTILPHQLEPVLAVTHGLGCRLLLADEVGLGKTVQAGLLIAEMVERSTETRTLVAVPAGLRDQWRQELAERFGLDSRILDAAALALAARSDAGGTPWTAAPVVITSIDYVKRPEVMRALEPLVWDIAVFDEAHALGPGSDRGVAATLLAERARLVILLSATPHNGDDAAFTRLCGTGDIGSRFPLLLFRRTRHDVGLAIARRTLRLRVQPTAAEREMHEALLAYARRIWMQTGDRHAARLAASVLARRACSSPASLATSVERRMAALEETAAWPLQLGLPLDDTDGDSPPDAALLVLGLRDRREEQQHLRRILALARRAMANESKLAALRRLLRRSREPALVFTQYRDTLAHVAAGVAPLDVALLHGGLTRHERRAALQQFTRGDRRILLATDAASEGLNLHQRCRLVVHLELPWTPVRLEQRVGRVERIGQRRRVHAVSLVARGTTEEQVMARLAERTASIHAALGAVRAVGTSTLHAAAHTGIADVIFGEPREQHGASVVVAASELPSGVVAPALTDLAAAEADRLRTSRALERASARHRGTGDGTPSAPALRVRPLVAALDRRPGTRALFWLFAHDIGTGEGELLWEQLIVLHAAGRVRTRLRPHDLRSLFNTAAPEVLAALSRERSRGRATAWAALEAQLRVALLREHAVAEAIGSRHARLSAALLQPGLFDRREQRAAAAQAAVRDEALARSAEHLRRLESRTRPVSLGCDLQTGLVAT